MVLASALAVMLSLAASAEAEAQGVHLSPTDDLSTAARSEPLARVRLVVPGDAPMTSGTSLAASAGATAVGAALMVAATARFVTDRNRQIPSVLGMYGCGFLLFNFGPNIADALQGDWGRLATRGLARMALLFLSAAAALFVPIGVLVTFVGTIAWVGWVLAEALDSIRAPERWAARHNEATAGVHSPLPSGLLFRF